MLKQVIRSRDVGMYYLNYDEHCFSIKECPCKVRVPLLQLLHSMSHIFFLHDKSILLMSMICVRINYPKKRRIDLIITLEIKTKRLLI